MKVSSSLSVPKRVENIMHLGKVIDIISGAPFKSDLFNETGDGLPLIRVRDVNTAPAGVFYSGEYSTEHLVQLGDILVSMDGDFKCISWPYGIGLLNQRVCKIIPKKDILDKSYLQHFLPKALAGIHRDTTFTTVKHLSTKTIKEIEIPLPPLDDQKRIAYLLSKVEGLIAQRKQHLQYLDDLLKSVFLEMFGDPDGWPSMPLSSIAADGKGTFSNGPFGSNLLTSELTDTGVPVIYIRDIRDARYERVSTVFVTEEKAQELDSCLVQPGDILIAKVGDPPGTTAIYPKGKPTGVITQDVIRLRPNTEIVNAEFVTSFLNSHIGCRLIRGITVEATRARFGLREFKMQEITVPPMNLQMQFAAIVEKVEGIKTRYQASLADLENLYGALSQKAFKGELDLSRVPLPPTSPNQP